MDHRNKGCEEIETSSCDVIFRILLPIFALLENLGLNLMHINAQNTPKNPPVLSRGSGGFFILLKGCS